MRLDCGSLGRELWLDFFSVIGQPWTPSMPVRSISPLLYVSTITHTLLISGWRVYETRLWFPRPGAVVGFLLRH